MSERKVLNKYYPPDFDASKLPRLKREKNRQFTIRLMAPFNMRCTTCGEYIYRGKKFNAKKEDVIGKTYLGIQVYRFYIKCTKCLAEITFLTDPENQDYAMEFGAIRNFESVRLAEIQAEKEAQKEKEEEENNPMKILENRTRDSRREMAALDALEDLRELNAAHAAVDASKLILEENAERRRQLELQQIEEDEAEIRRIFGNKNKEPSLYGQIEEEIIEEEEQEEESENEEEKDDRETETNAAKKFKSEPTEHDESESATNSQVKRIKVEPTPKEEEPKSSSVLFKKPVVLAAPKTVLDTKSKISSLIKKKPEPEKPKVVNPLASLASYSSDESESD